MGFTFKSVVPFVLTRWAKIIPAIETKVKSLSEYFGKSDDDETIFALLKNDARINITRDHDISSEVVENDTTSTDTIEDEPKKRGRKKGS